MYDTKPQHFNLPNMVSDVYKTVHGCRSYGQKESHMKHQRKFQLFLAAELLPFVIVNSVGDLQRTTTGIEHIVKITERSSKFKRAIPTVKFKPTNKSDNTLEQLGHAMSDTFICND